MRLTQIGAIAIAEGEEVSGDALTAGGLKIKVGDGTAVSVGASQAGTGAGQSAESAWAKAEAINSAGVSGLLATAKTSVTAAFTDLTVGSGGGTYTLTINDVDVFGDVDATGITADDVVAAVNASSNETGVTAEINEDGDIVFTAADGRDIT